MRVWLRRAGYAAEVFASAEGCLEALGRLLPDAVFLDLSLPGMSGIDALTPIREAAPGVPVVILTTDQRVQTVVQAMRLGAYDYVPKPLHETKLLATLANALEKARMSE